MDTVVLVISSVAICIAVPSVFVARHYFHETKKIEERFHARRKEQSVAQKSQQGKSGGDYPRYSS